MRSRGRIAFALLLLPFAGSRSMLLRRGGPDFVVGTVRDSAGPVAGAVVRFPGHSPAVRSDDRGRFRLPAAGGAGATVTAAKANYFIAASRTGGGPLALSL